LSFCDFLRDICVMPYCAVLKCGAEVATGTHLNH